MNMISFLKARQNGIGGSDISAILGVSRFKTPLDVYLAKINPNPEESHQDHLYWGHALENPIIDRFIEETGFEVIREPDIAMLENKPWVIANADGLIIKNGKIDGILEIKTSSAFSLSEWGNSDTDSVPLAYIAQVQWYMAVFNVDYAYLAVLIGGNQYRQYYIKRDQELINLMLEKAHHFWHEHIEKQIPPEPTNEHDLQRLYPKDDGSIIEADTESLIAINELKELRENKKNLENLITEKEVLLKAKLGSHSMMTIDGQPLIIFKACQSNRFDTTKFKASYPDLYQQFTKQTLVRTFRVK